MEAQNSDHTGNPENPVASKIRVGIIGVGNWATFGHIPVLQLLPDYEVIAVQSRRKEAAEEAAAKFNIKYVLDTAEQVAAHPEVDLVLVLTIPPLHADGIRLAVAAGKDVYSEWPFTTNSETAQELVDLVRKAGVKHMIGLQRRLSPTTRYLRDLIQQGYIGNFRSVRLYLSVNYFQALREIYLRWTIAPENFSSVIAIYAGHYLDVLFGIVGKPVSFSALQMNQFPEVTDIETNLVYHTTTPDQLIMSGVLAGNVVFSVHMEGGKRNGSGVQFDFTGDTGDLKATSISAFGDIGEGFVIEGAQGNNIPLNILNVPDSYSWISGSDLATAPYELAHLYAAYASDRKNGTQTVTTFEDGLWMHRLMDQMILSSETGQRIIV